MVWAGSAQEDHASGEMGSPSDGTFWHVTSVPNTGGGSITSGSLRARPCYRAPACPELLVPVVYGAAIFSAPLEDRQRGVRVAARRR
jgi:hypothetical protein